MAKKKTTTKKVTTKRDANKKAFKNVLDGFARMGTLKKEEFVPTGHFNLDFALRYGKTPDKVSEAVMDEFNPSEQIGLPMGRVIEFFGPEGGGKSSLAYRVTGAAQKLGKNCLWVDTEQSFKESLAELNGVDTTTLAYSDLMDADDEDKVYTAEDVFDKMTEACKAGFDVIVLDSVANLIPKAELEGSTGDQQIALLARVITKGIKKLGQAASHNNTMVILINQLREKPGVMFGCLHGDTKVPFVDGSVKTMKEIHDNKEYGPIYAYDHINEKIIETNILNHFNNGQVEDGGWITFKTTGPGTKNGVQSFTCTPDHILFLNDGSEVPAKEVKKGYKLLSNRESFLLNDDINRQVIFASLLGDGELIRRKESTSCFSLANSEQPGYLSWKKNLINGASWKEVGKLRKKHQTDYSVELNTIKDMFYNNGKGYRQIPSDLSLTPLMLCIWYMDDAYYDKNGGHNRISLSIKRFKNKPDQISRALNLLNGYESNGNKIFDGMFSYSSSQKAIKLKTEATELFLKEIAPYACGDMEYKFKNVNGDLPEGYMSKNDYLFENRISIEKTNIPYEVLVKSVVKSSKRKYRNRIKYDMETEVGNYLICGNPGIIVHNSPESTPGGRALKHAASVRLRISPNNKAEALLHGEIVSANGSVSREVVGRNVNIKVEKSRLGPPVIDEKGNKVPIQVPIYYKAYFPDINSQIFDQGRAMKIISVRTGVFSWNGIKVEGKEDFMREVSQNGLLRDLVDAIEEEAHLNGRILPPELTQVIEDDLIDEDFGKTATDFDDAGAPSNDEGDE